MPAKNAGQSKLLSKLGNRMRTSHEAHKNDEMKTNEFSNLPPNIDKGVARLDHCGFREVSANNKEFAGEIEFFATAVVVDPIEHTYEDPPGSKNFVTVQVHNKQTRYREVLCDTPKSQSKKKTFDDHYASVLNLMRILGYDTSGMSPEQMESAAEALTNAKPYFKFRTSLLPAADGQAPRVYEDWFQGPVDSDYTPPEVDMDNDQTAVVPAASKNGTASSKAAMPSNEPPADLEFGDIDSLVEKAALNDQSEESVNAQDQLTKMAMEHGKTQEEVDASDSWSEVAGWIRGEEPDAEPEPVTPKKGQFWKALLIDPKTKKKSSKATQVQVLTDGKDSCDVKSMVDKKTYKSVPFSDMTPIS